MKKVLIVEDSPYYYERAKKIAEEIGLQVVIANTGKQGVLKYNQEKPDFVIMDICMPEMDGLAATAVIKNKDENARIFICSSVGHVPIYRKQAIANGAMGILPKEFDKYDLLETIELIRNKNK